MATITEDYVSYETAKILKEKGFDEPIQHFYKCNNKELYRGTVFTNTQIGDKFYNAPTLQMAMKWLREVHSIYLNINVRVILGQWSGYDISVYTTNNDGFLNKDIPIKLKDNISYEQAVEAGIKYALENLI